MIAGSFSEFLEEIKNCSSEGPLPELGYLDLSWNQLVGRLPERLSHRKLTYLDLSHNKLQGPILISLGSNELNGSLPVSFGQLSELVKLDVSLNRMTGILSEEHFSKLSKLKELWINGNSGLVLNVSSTWVPPFQVTNLSMASCNLGPSFPNWLRTQKEVFFLDLSNASISGFIPKWFWNISLNHRLSGELPSSFQNLSRLELLDLSYNQLSGKVPSWIGTAFINLVILNLRSNVFFGRLPSQLSNLSSLHVLDLAQNNLMGEIPVTLFELKAMVRHFNVAPLLSLDLSRNKLSSIPSSMVSLTFLSYLNLSNNNFSGKIPFIGQMSTFSESAFVGNPNLCGAPLVTKCQDEDLDKKCSAIEDKNDGGYIDQWFYLSVGLGFAMGILIPYFVLATRKSWCEAYFDFVDKIVKWLLRGRATCAKDHLRR
ncbi:hypothetical protein AAG906_021668 [Vitis piasezkii]